MPARTVACFIFASSLAPCISFPPFFFFQGNLVLVLSLRHGTTHRAAKLGSLRKVRSVSKPDRASLQTTPPHGGNVHP
uniref:Putative secreted protein n=1 Tax=Ixodes ricinus TaxID=34613 RepID=A0A6B0U540_IXORI